MAPTLRILITLLSASLFLTFCNTHTYLHAHKTHTKLFSDSSEVLGTISNKTNPSDSLQQSAKHILGVQPINRAYYKMSEIIDFHFPLWRWSLPAGGIAVDVGEWRKQNLALFSIYM